MQTKISLSDVATFGIDPNNPLTRQIDYAILWTSLYFRNTRVPGLVDLAIAMIAILYEVASSVDARANTAYSIFSSIAIYNLGPGS